MNEKVIFRLEVSGEGGNDNLDDLADAFRGIGIAGSHEIGVMIESVDIKL